jgi:GT2 family glycosyltransferase
LREVTELSVVIVSYNAREDLARCLRSLRDPRPAVSHEIVVVDNGSSDGSVSAARGWPDVRVIELGQNLGFAAASNVGIRATAGRHVLLLNSDTIVPEGAIDRLLDVLNRHPEAAVVGPRLVDESGQPELSFGRMLSPLNEIRQKRLTHAAIRGTPWAVRRVERMTRQAQWPDWVSGACLLVRREDAERVGLLDERYFMYTEDVDFCAAIRAAGRRILYAPEVEVVHLRGRSVASAAAATRAAYYRSHVAFYEKHHPKLAPFLRLYLRLSVASSRVPLL